MSTMMKILIFLLMVGGAIASLRRMDDFPEDEFFWGRFVLGGSYVMSGCMSVGPPPTTTHVTVRALIDGRSELRVQYNQVWWYHGEKAAPGLHERTSFEDKGEPTFVNDVEWFPEWPDPQTLEQRECFCESTTKFGLGEAGVDLGSEPFLVSATAVSDPPERPGSSTRLIESPADGNDWLTRFEIDDIPPSGSAWYTIKLWYKHSPAPTTRVIVKALIDGRSELRVQENQIWWYHSEYAAPGLHLRTSFDDKGEPTIVNEVKWFPEWPDPQTLEQRDCFCETTTKFNLCEVGVDLGNEPFLVSATAVSDPPERSGSSTSLMESPADGNDWLTRFEINDNPPGGSAWYTIELQFVAGGGSADECY